MEGSVLRVSRSCAISLDELEWKFTGSGGPGGQHANTSNTKVELRFVVANSPSLGPRQRVRLLDGLRLAVPGRVGYDRCDRVMAVYAPLSLLTIATISLPFLFVGYDLVFAGLEQNGWRHAFLMSGSSLFTLGFLEPHGLLSTFVAF